MNPNYRPNMPGMNPQPGMNPNMQPMPGFNPSFNPGMQPYPGQGQRPPYPMGQR